VQLDLIAKFTFFATPVDLYPLAAILKCPMSLTRVKRVFAMFGTLTRELL